MNHTESEKQIVEERMVEFWNAHRLLHMANVQGEFDTTYDRINAALEYWRSKPTYRLVGGEVETSTPCYDSTKLQWDMAVKLALLRSERELGASAS